MMRHATLARINYVRDYLAKHGPLQVDNLYQVARQVGMDTQTLTRVLGVVRSPEWIATHGWTIPYVKKGTGRKVYSAVLATANVPALREGNGIKTMEVETHLRRSLAGLDLETRIATGVEQQKAMILATTTKAALAMIDQITP